MEQAFGGRQSRAPSYTDSNTATYIDPLSKENVREGFLYFLVDLDICAYANIHSYNELITNTRNNNMLNLFYDLLKLLF